MHIAIFIKKTTFHKGYGGLATQNKMLAEGLAARGHDVTVFSPKEDIEEETIINTGVKYVFIDAVYRMGIFFQGFEDKLAKILKKVVPKFNYSGIFSDKGNEDWIAKSYATFCSNHEEYPFDIVLCQSAIGLGLIRNKENHCLPVISISHGSIIGEFKSVMSTLSFKDFLSLKFLLKFIRDFAYVVVNFFTRQREFIHGSDRVVAVSTAVKNQLIEETFANENKFVVIHNGIKPPAITGGEKKDNQKIKLISAGRVDKSKGIQILLEALRDVDKSHWQLEVIGEGSDLEYLINLTEKLSLSSCVFYSGKISHEEVLHKMPQADIFILPSLRVEGFPMVLVEAMFAGLPVIASDIGGNADAVVNNETGLLVEAGDTKGLKNAVEILISDTDLRLKMAKNAKLRATNNFTLAIMIEKYEKIMKEVLNENS